MHFSLFFELQTDSASGITDYQLFRNCLEQAVAADEMGYHCVWAVEHHGLYEYSHSSAPEVFLSFAAARTRRVRLGHGVTLTPGRFNHPIRIAERVAALDLLSDGRVNWGSGKSSSNVEAMTFEIDENVLDAQWEEALRMVSQIWRSEVFSWDGEHYKVPPVRIHPKPLQQPHPPMFAPAASDQAARRVGRLGLGMLSFSQQTYDELCARVALYRSEARAARPTGYQGNNHVAVTTNTVVLDDDHQACVHGFAGGRFFWECLKQYYGGPRPPVDAPLPVARGGLHPMALSMSKSLRRVHPDHLYAIVGDPIYAREKVAMFQQSGVDELILVMQLGPVPHDIVMQSMRCFADKVMCHFA